MLYLPALSQTLIMGGCDGLNATDGSVTRCVSFSSGYLVHSMVTPSKEASVPIKEVSMGGPIPSPRLSPCTVVLSNGDVFMYGGVTLTGAMNDAWFSQPQVAIINTTGWEWSTNFVPAHSPDADGMSSGLVIGITVGGTVILCVIFFMIGRLLWERQQLKKQRLLGKKGYNASRMSQSTQPLMESGELYSQDSDLGSTAMVSFASNIGPFDSRQQHLYHSDFYQQQRNRSGSHTSYDSGLDGSRTLASHRTGEREREPFLIIPYSPTDLASDTTRIPSEAAVKSHPVGHTKRDSHGTMTSSTSSIEKGDQLPQTLADIQHSQYVKTLQHQKMYERRRQELEQQQQFRLNRSQTQHTVAGGHHYDGMDGGNNLDLATAVIALKEVDVGEEPFTGGWYDDNDGTVLLSSHLDQSQA
ncbi:hypothetical protein BGX34_009572 [Mortierella sp. NVP85]|nr:hypothetical protein BGX34_009572 [Mortierella sp. NVP85]